MYFGASIGITAASAVAAFRTPAIMNLVSRGGWMALIGTFAVVSWIIDDHHLTCCVISSLIYFRWWDLVFLRSLFHTVQDSDQSKWHGCFIQQSWELSSLHYAWLVDQLCFEQLGTQLELLEACPLLQFAHHLRSSWLWVDLWLWDLELSSHHHWPECSYQLPLHWVQDLPRSLCMAVWFCSLDSYFMIHKRSSSELKTSHLLELNSSIQSTIQFQSTWTH